MAPETGAPPTDPNSLSSEELFRCDDPALTAGLSRFWRLSDEQYRATVAAVFKEGWDKAETTPFAGIYSDNVFNNQAAYFGMPEATAEQAFSIAEKLATKYRSKVQQRFACLAQAPLTDACVRGAFTELVSAAFRRPAATDELDRFTAVVLNNQAELGADFALELGLSSMLVAPDFLFRWEVGNAPDASGRRKLNPFEVASAIAFTLTDAPPDAELLAEASTGGLQTLESIELHVRRLLGQLGEHGGTARFFEEYFNYPHATEVFKDKETRPWHDAQALVESTRRFFAHFAPQPAFMQNLLLSSSAFVNAKTAESYDTQAIGDDFQLVQLPATERAGILTQPSFLSAWSEAEQNDPIRRGRLVRERLLCGTVPDLPIGVVPQLPELENATLRTRLQIHSELPECRACHQFMDPIGLGLEAFDDTGKFRTMELGQPVDTSGEIIGAGEVDGPFNGHRELGERLAGATAVRQCVIRHGLRYWLGRGESALDRCTLAKADERFSAANQKLEEVIVALVASDSVLYRKAQP